MAPGTAIVSSVPGDKFAAFDGTSMAAPYVSGLLALMRERVSPDVAGSDDLLDALRQTSLRVVDERNGLKFAVPQVEAAIKAIQVSTGDRRCRSRADTGSGRNAARRAGSG